MDIIRDKITKQMNDGEWKSLPIATAGFEPHVQLIYMREYVPEVFGGYLVVVWIGLNRNLILPENLSDTVKFYTVAGVSPLVVSELHDLMDGIKSDEGQDGIVSVDVPVVCKGTVSLCYMSPSNMAQYDSFDDVRDKMASYVAEMIKSCFGYILYYNDSFIDMVMDKLAYAFKDIDIRVGGYARIARLDELLDDMDFDSFLPNLIAQRAYYIGFMDYISSNWSMQIEKIPFPSTFDGQLRLLETIIQFDRTDPKDWFDRHRGELIMSDILNPFIEPDNVELVRA